MSDTSLTKQDLIEAFKNVATKDDLKNLPTKHDLDIKINSLREELKEYIFQNNEVVFNGIEQLLKEQYVSKAELAQILQTK